MIAGKIVGIRKDSRKHVSFVAVLLSVEDACKAVKNGTLALVTESQHGIQKEVTVKNTGRSDDSDYLTTSRDPSESNNIDDQREI